MSIISTVIQDLTQYVKRFTGTAAPSSTPDRAGSLHFDTTAKKMYASYGADDEYDWGELANAEDTSLRDFGICQGRLTLESGVPVSTSDQIGKETLYFTPYNGSMIDIFDGTNWVRRKFTEISLSIATLIENTVYDIFCDYAEDAFILSAVAWDSPSGGAITSISNASPRVASTSTPPTTGTLVTIKGNSVAGNNKTWRIGTVVAGTSFALLNLDSTNSSSPGSVGSDGTFTRKDENQERATVITKQDGILVQGNKRYLGSIKMTDVAGQCEFSRGFRGVWNQYNRVEFLLYNYAADYTTLTKVSTYYLPANDFANSVYFIIGQIEDYVKSIIVAKIDPSDDGVSAYLYCVLNSKSTLSSGEEVVVGFASGPPSRLSCSDFSHPLLGANYANILMNASASSVVVSLATLKLMIKM